MKLKHTTLDKPDRKERADSARNKLQSVGITLTYMSGWWASTDAITAKQVHDAAKASNPDLAVTTYPATGTKVFDMMSGPIRVTLTIDREKFILQQGIRKEELDSVDFSIVKKCVKLITDRINAAL